MRIKKVDINTMIKVINGMSEKIEVFKIMFIDTMTERINKCFNKFDKIDDRLEALENKLNHLDNNILTQWLKKLKY